MTYKDRSQKTRIVYVSNENISYVKKMIKDYAKYRDLTEQLVETNIELLRRKAKT